MQITDPSSNHTSAVVAVDEKGNVAAVVHSINTIGTGTSGIFVDGVSISDPAATKQKVVYRTGRGKHLVLYSNPLIVLKNGKPVFASSAVAMGLHEVTIQWLVNVIDYGMDPKQALDTVKFGVPGFSIKNLYSGENKQKQTILKGDFPQEMIDSVEAMGQELQIQESPLFVLGYLAGIKIDLISGKRLGAVSKDFSGYALGY